MAKNLKQKLTQIYGEKLWGFAKTNVITIKVFANMFYFKQIKLHMISK